jgi:ubiquinone/menaquinone biosynthesis C-methylase UbiE
MRVVLELACGEGRHSEQIVDQVSQLILMDVNEPNIKACQHRFKNYNHVRAIQNNGYNLEPLATNSIDSIFCYDAMVHFEMNIIESYLKESYRVLKPNGKAIFHHSNLTDCPGNYYQQNPHWRNFMSKELFAHLAKRSGFKVLEQVLIDWGEGAEHYSNLDCITLLLKGN